jgi:hypothetical protein
VPATISWSGSACANAVSGCNIASYHLQESVNGATFVDVPLSSPIATSVSRVLKPSPINQSTFTTYRYQVQATSTTGVTSAFTIAPFFVLPAIDDTTSTSFNGSWSGTNLVGAFNGQVHFSSTAGAFAGPAGPVPASSLALVATVGPDRGLAQVTVDGVVATVDLYSPTLQAGQVVWSTGGLSTSVNHTVKVTALGTHNTAATGSRVDYDALLALR